MRMILYLHFVVAIIFQIKVLKRGNSAQAIAYIFIVFGSVIWSSFLVSLMIKIVEQ